LNRIWSDSIRIKKLNPYPTYLFSDHVGSDRVGFGSSRVNPSGRVKNRHPYNKSNMITKITTPIIWERWRHDDDDSDDENNDKINNNNDDKNIENNNVNVNDDDDYVDDDDDDDVVIKNNHQDAKADDV
jgi:hypothetical protein